MPHRRPVRQGLYGIPAKQKKQAGQSNYKDSVASIQPPSPAIAKTGGTPGCLLGRAVLSLCVGHAQEWDAALRRDGEGLELPRAPFFRRARRTATTRGARHRAFQSILSGRHWMPRLWRWPASSPNWLFSGGHEGTDSPPVRAGQGRSLFTLGQHVVNDGREDQLHCIAHFATRHHDVVSA